MRRLKRGDGGLTLIELAVAVLILSIGSIAAIRTADQSRRAIGGEMPRLLAAIAARNRAEELQISGVFADGLPGTVRQGGQVISVSTEDKATAGGLRRTTITARSASGEGAVMVVYFAPRGTAP